MAHLIPMFKFTLGHDQSIGPAALRTLWEEACRTADVSVARHAGGFGSDGRPTYSLFAPQQLQDLSQVESRLRRALEESHLRASLIVLHS